MIDFQVTYDKLSNFESAQEIREYFNSLGIKGFTCNGSRCPIATFITQETGEQVTVEPHHIARANKCGNWAVAAENTPAMVDFIDQFDDWCYPELIHPEEKDYLRREFPNSTLLLGN